MEEPDYDVKKEQILSRLDYAIHCVRDLQFLSRSITIHKTSWENMCQLLKDIEKLVKEY